MGLLPAKFQGYDEALQNKGPLRQQHFEHVFYNPDLRFFLLYSSKNLYAEYKKQKKEILDRVPETDKFPSIFSIAYDASWDVHTAKLMLESNIITQDDLVYGEKSNGFMQGASFQRVRKHTTFTPNEIYKVILSRQHMDEKRKKGMLFAEDGKRVTQAVFNKRWNAAEDKVVRYRSSRDTLGAIVKALHSLEGDGYYPEL